MTNNRLTRAQVEDFLSKHLSKESALEVLQDAGLVDEHGNLTPPYQPDRSKAKQRSLKDYADIGEEQILSVRDWLSANINWFHCADNNWGKERELRDLLTSESERYRD